MRCLVKRATGFLGSCLYADWQAMVIQLPFSLDRQMTWGGLLRGKASLRIFEGSYQGFSLKDFRCQGANRGV
jgi:hypothetical protein